uniref:Uncharacterized protein n=1 Tax=Octopus bimaculoides TaxID=37653 RepID=A0A0L8IDM6_OCTBM
MPYLVKSAFFGYSSKHLSTATAYLLNFLYPFLLWISILSSILNFSYLLVYYPTWQNNISNINIIQPTLLVIRMDKCNMFHSFITIVP